MQQQQYSIVEKLASVLAEVENAPSQRDRLTCVKLTERFLEQRKTQNEQETART